MKKALITLMAGLISSPAMAVYQPENGEKQKFKLMLEDTQVGIYHIEYSVPQDGAIVATTTSLFKVSALGKDLADVRSKSNELIWQGQFVELQGVAQNGDDKYQLKMNVLKNGKMRIKSEGYDDDAPVGTLPFSFWNADTLKAKFIFDAINQKITPMEHKKIRAESISVLGERKTCIKYKLKNDDGSLYLWYGEEDEKLCRVQIRGGKFKLTYLPYE